MALKIKANNDDVITLLNKYKDENRYDDLLEILDIMKKVSGESPKLWGKQMIGFGSYNYKTKTTEGSWFLTGFSPRKNNIAIYIIAGFKSSPLLMEKLGTYKTGKSCLYIKRLTDVNKITLEELILKSINITKSNFN